jgi:thymidine kinase
VSGVSTPQFSGSIEIICGPMFSGKTEELIRRVRRAQIARRKVQIFKPLIDNRYHETDVVSHSAVSIEATPVGDALEILDKLLDSTRIVAIDEVQFFDESVITLVKKLSRRGIRVICSGLDLDYRGRCFGPIPELLAIADQVDKIQAICTTCGLPATKTYRKPASGSSEQVLLGETDVYEARCNAHFDYGEEEREELVAFNSMMKKRTSSMEAMVELAKN